MDRTATLQLVKFLCWKSGVKEPSIITWSRRDGGRYFPGKRRMLVPADVRHEWVVLHEVAHHVCAMRAPRISRAEQRLHAGLRRGRKVSHGVVFTETLTELAALWHGDPAKHNWQAEYACVRRAFEERHA